jgi:hypothetical protein
LLQADQGPQSLTWQSMGTGGAMQLRVTLPWQVVPGPQQLMVVPQGRSPEAQPQVPALPHTWPAGQRVLSPEQVQLGALQLVHWPAQAVAQQWPALHEPDAHSMPLAQVAPAVLKLQVPA